MIWSLLPFLPVLLTSGDTRFLKFFYPETLKRLTSGDKNRQWSGQGRKGLGCWNPEDVNR